MWTYRNSIQAAPNTLGHKTFQSVGEFTSPPVVANTHSGNPSFRSRIQATRRKQSRGLVTSVCLLYLVGIVCGICISRLCSSALLDYMKYYTATAANRFINKQYSSIFYTEFLSLFLQLTVILLAGLCVFGVVVIPVILFVKGVGIGCFFSFIYLQFGLAKGFFVEVLFFLLPELISVLILCSISLVCWRVSQNLLNSCLRFPTGKLSENIKKMMYRYIKLCAVSVLPCAVSVLMSAVFSPLF